VTTDTLSTNTILSTLPFVLKKLLCVTTCYFDGELKRFKLNKQGALILIKAQHSQNNKQLIQIVDRPFYSEQAKGYPIDNKKELKKLLALESLEPHNSQNHIWHSENGMSQVNSWQYSNEVPEAIIRLPISLLLALAAKNNQVVQTFGENKFYLARSNKLIHSLPHSAVVNSSKRFAISAGIAQVELDKRIAEQNFALELALGFKKVLPLLTSFFIMPKIENRFQLLKNIVLPFTLVFTSYLALSSAYIMYQKNNLEQALANQGEKVSIALTQQNTFDKQFQRYTALQSFFEVKKTKSNIWLLMSDLYPYVTLSNVRLIGERFVVRGKAPIATQILEKISNKDFVLDAKFDFPTRKYRGQEEFVISFELMNGFDAKPKDINNKGQ